MPFGKIPKENWKKKQYIQKISAPLFTRRKKKGKGIVNLNKSLNPSSGFPESLKVKLCYSQFGNFTVPGSTVNGGTIFLTNSLFDPWYSGGGSQAMYRDQLYALYDEAVVYGFKYIIQLSSNSTVPYYAAVEPSLTLAIDTDISGLTERGQSKCKVLSEGHPSVFKGYVSIAKQFGTTKSRIMSDDLFSHSASGNPTNKGCIKLCAVDPTSAGGTCYFRIEATFYTVFRKRAEVSRS